MKERAYEIREGVLRPCEYLGPERRIPRPYDPLQALKPPAKLTRRERRSIARRGTRGRRGARRVSIWAPPRFFPIDYDREVAHAYSDGRSVVYLYLPEGESPSPEHALALDRVRHVEAEIEREKFRVMFSPPGSARTIMVSPYLLPGTETTITTGAGNVVKIAPGESVEIAPIGAEGKKS